MHRLRPGGLQFLQVVTRYTRIGQKLARADGYRGDKAEQEAQRNDRRRVGAVGLILVFRCVTQADLFLIVQPGLIVRTKAGIQHPLHKAFLNPRFVLLIRFARGVEEPFRQVRLRADHGAPGIDHRSGVTSEDCAVAL